MPQNIPRGSHVTVLKDLPTPGIPKDSVGVVDQDGAVLGGTVHAVFPNGMKLNLYNGEYWVRRLVKADPVLQPNDYLQYTVFKCVIGSRAYGLHDEDSDHDYRGVYLPPAELHWSLFGVPESLEFKEPDAVYWEFGRFMHLAMKANPSIIECLWTPLVYHKDPLFEELYNNRHAFLSRLVYQTYNGYAISQLKKIEDSIRLHGAINWKQAMHMIRLLLNGAELMRTGEVTLSVEDHRQNLLDVRHGVMGWEQVDHWRRNLLADFEVALAVTKLPDKPDYAILNRVLVNARQRMVSHGT